MSTQAALFDAKEGERLKELGMSRARSSKYELVKLAKNIAVTIALRNGDVNADQVYVVMDAFGQRPELLGNAWGSVFRDCPRFEWTGKWVASKRTSNHGRMIRVWRLR